MIVRSFLDSNVVVYTDEHAKRERAVRPGRRRRLPRAPERGQAARLPLRWGRGRQPARVRWWAVAGIAFRCIDYVNALRY